MRAVRKCVGENTFLYLVCDRCGVVLAVVTGRDLNIYFPNEEEKRSLCVNCAIEEYANDGLQEDELPF